MTSHDGPTGGGLTGDGILDDPDALAAADPSGVLRALAGAGAQIRHACDLTDEAGVERLTEDRPRGVVVAARGGAAVVADAVATLAGPASPVPVVARTGDVLPGWVGPLDLVVAVSLSGRSEPAVRLAGEAGRRGARLLTVGAAGSPLAEVCGRARGVHVPLPEPGRAATSAPTSRTALWGMLVPVLVAGTRLGLLDAGRETLADVADVLDEEAELCRPASEAFVNPAKSLATELEGTVPLVLGDGPVTAVAARRAASVLARTARLPALAGTLPDDAGDVVATFGGALAAHPDDVFADPFLDGVGAVGPRLRLLLLRSTSGGHADPVVAIAEAAGVRVSDVVAEPAGVRDGGPRADLLHLARLVARTDFAATYLALATGSDPGASPHVADLRDATR